MPPKEAGPPSRAELLQAVAASQKVAQAQEYATSLREKAATLSNPSERERLVEEAYAREVEAHGERSKIARRLQSGTWQGGAAGGGIGLGTGLGLGTLVGTLLSGVLSIPTAGLGILIGAGVGAIHGPWIKVGGKDKKWQDATPEEVVAYYEEQNAQNQSTAEQALTYEQPIGPVMKKKPRKLEVRSQANAAVGAPVDAEDTISTGTPRRPKKLQLRSQSQVDSLAAMQREMGKENVDAVQEPKDG
ncbi:hypothetical protein CLAFUW4_00215 [Fulvia fulva]|uniref:Uncharacterized protein n=1 Tax=Passalora fulva TaxID=5499 RepID=A0A9Q8L6J9_PASFU|nr:uncharacterized protein CLAFUR5_00215 [Fulvia fulva]KAK4635559.1 hypothetical protein CLAFUR4_00215 [Fulvia fulva]KAK4638160.1 hypothetical protein CLAFUR0_00216 [Fulvia fulva]UJO11810.1 hypothetical protein CLAFUR5_00215 [Fulvia fulva]WPV09529.1 hypothetical protein CLAFUW4_00215 [Fulvia fulva]WPV23726.1 hypothetical protein CLAFUW7_00218 [Fulvia fulva]